MDNPENSVLRDLEIKTYLHFDHKKFWEIRLDGHSLESTIRYGKLLDDDIEEPSSVQVSRKVHTDLTEGYQYIEQHINLKKEKGYKKLVKETDDLSKYDPTPKRPVPSTTAPTNPLKRKNEESLMPENLKQVHKNEPENPLEKTQFLEISRASLGNGSHSQKSLAMEVESEFKIAQRSQLNFSQQQDDSDTLASYKGAYLEKLRGDKMHFFKIQVLKQYLKTETGFAGDSRSTSCGYRIYSDRKRASDKAHDEIKDKLKDNYRFNNELFVFDFTESEAGIKLGLMPRLPKSTPSSPTKALSDAPPEEKRPATIVKESAKMKEIEYAKDLLENSDSELSCEDSRSLGFNKKEFKPMAKPQFKRSETRIRSASPERNSAKKKDRFNIDESPLGDPVDGIYASLQQPSKYAKQTIDGWYFSEKMDGIRCFWDGSTLLSGKRGKRHIVPDFFTENFPKSPLDGELWLGKGKSATLASLLNKKKPKDNEWNNVKFVVYDAPELTLPFKKRVEKMREVFKVPLSPYITLYEYKNVKDKNDLDNVINKIEKEGGDGLMLRDPQAFYEKGKSCSMLEVNTSHEDEAIVTAHEEGKGKKEGVVGALRVRNLFGIEFSISMGLTDKLRKHPPKVGSKIRYRFRGVNEENIPKHATLIRDDDD